MNCICCNKQRKQLYPVDALIGDKVLLCNRCRSAGHQPRHMIILLGRSKSVANIRGYIKDSKYCGEDVSARELMV